MNTHPADANGHKFNHPGLDLGFAATHGFDLDTYRAAALDKTAQHENSKEDKIEGKHQPAYIPGHKTLTFLSSSPQLRQSYD